jgi:hypothetical protein
MPDITISITDTEKKAMDYVALSAQSWAEHAVTNRARIAIDEICAILMNHCNENSIAIAVGKDAQVTQAYDLGIVNAAANIEPTPVAEQS